MDEQQFERLFETIKSDSSLLSDINIDELLGSVEDDNNDLENKTLQEILENNIQVLDSLELTEDQKEKYISKLADYKYIDNLYQLNKGKYIRWINKQNKLTNGAIVLEIIFNDNGTNIMCKNTQHRCLQLKFDDCTIFQKLSYQEQVILMAYEYLQKKE